MFDPYAVKAGDFLVRVHHNHPSNPWTQGKHYVVTGDPPCVTADNGKITRVRDVVNRRFELLQEGPW